MGRFVLALALCALVCLGSVSFASGMRGDDLGFVETESVESLQAAAAALQKQAAAQAAVEQAELDEHVRAQLEQLATNPEALENEDAASQALLEHAAMAPQDMDTEAMTHVFSEEQFHDEVDPTLLDTESTVDARIQAEIEHQVAQHTLDSIRQEQKETAELQAYLAEQAGESVEGEMGDDVLLQSGDSSEAEIDPVTQEAHAISDALEASEDYPVMIESAAQSRSTAKGVPEVMKNAWHSAVNGAKGLAHKLKRHISSAFQREHAHQPAAHSFLAARSHMRAQHKAKEGDQWWLEKAPWFLPPPPEWGPMPVTMYTSYFHKPVFPHHLDYAHGIPLPHAEALNLARRTYPQPPFEVQAAGDASFMEVASESRAEAEAPLDDESLAEIEALSQAEEQFQREEEPALIQLSAQAMMHAEADGSSEAESEQHAESGAEMDAHPHFLLDATASALPERLDATAVEAVEVDDLAHASPLKEEEILSVPM